MTMEYMNEFGNGRVNIPTCRRGRQPLESLERIRFLRTFEAEVERVIRESDSPDQVMQESRLLTVLQKEMLARKRQALESEFGRYDYHSSL